MALYDCNGNKRVQHANRDSIFNVVNRILAFYVDCDFLQLQVYYYFKLISM